jgi:hypothetical protein
MMEAPEISEELLARLEEGPVEAVVISAIAPTGGARIRSACRRLRRRAPGAKILVGLWHAPQRLERMRRPLLKEGADLLCASYKSAFKVLEEELPPHPAPESGDESGDNSDAAEKQPRLRTA